MDVVRGRPAQGKVERRDGTFTGTVWGDLLLTSPEGLTISTSYFAPGARTYWHRHDGGQIVHVTSGEGMVVNRDGSAARVRTGDIVWSPPSEEHWHGARNDTFFVHTTASLGSTTWLDEVTEEDYRRGLEAGQPGGPEEPGR